MYSCFLFSPQKPFIFPAAPFSFNLRPHQPPQNPANPQRPKTQQEQKKRQARKELFHELLQAFFELLPTAAQY